MRQSLAPVSNLFYNGQKTILHHYVHYYTHLHPGNPDFYT